MAVLIRPAICSSHRSVLALLIPRIFTEGGGHGRDWLRRARRRGGDRRCRRGPAQAAREVARSPLPPYRPVERAGEAARHDLETVPPSPAPHAYDIRGEAKAARAVEEEADVVHVHRPAAPRGGSRRADRDAEAVCADLVQEFVDHEGEEEGGEHAALGDARVAVHQGRVQPATEAEPDEISAEERLEDPEQRARDALAPEELPE